ncbi:hypothetical protein C2845_PM03G03460 [Panicum miliaceum]|uniref:Reverse transcriptase zinc-binding domain-containing protein n=1 Tax=Panicum miliaceum TaxID=4540 RepID=A0A3L6T6M6_PANMI|nr:hypothetical protein C2845_PM03G03460 [Panicum miliaceum]
MEDTIAWHYEKSGCFTIRSAYRLRIDMKELSNGQTGSSNRPDSFRPILKKLWSLPVPQKVKVFAWRLIHKGLATKKNKMERHLELSGTCDVCGQEVEDEFHAVVRCDQAANLRETMRDIWDLPSEDFLRFSWPDWLLQLVGTLDQISAGRLLLILWRAWFNQNEIVHRSKEVSIVGSAAFLGNYWEELCTTKQHDTTDSKGKKSIWVQKPKEVNDMKVAGKATSKPADPGWVKINVDGTFSEQTGEAGVGVVIRDHLGKVLLAAWRVIFDASSVEEVEALACKEDVLLAAEWQETQQSWNLIMHM